MAITQTLTLPNQPPVGAVEYIPLGGNGWTAPQSAFAVDWRITGDVSGGATRWVLNRDPRFEHILQFMMIESDSATAITYRMDIFRGISAGAVHNVGTTALSAVIGHVLASQMWVPPPIIDPNKFEAKIDNVSTEVGKFKLLIYNFNIRASEEMPLSMLLASLSRAASAV